jgi:hypothetical protein
VLALPLLTLLFTHCFLGFRVGLLLCVFVRWWGGGAGESEEKDEVKPGPRNPHATPALLHMLDATCRD